MLKTLLRIIGHVNNNNEFQALPNGYHPWRRNCISKLTVTLFRYKNGYICTSVTVIYMKLSGNVHHVMTLHHTSFHINTPFISRNTYISIFFFPKSPYKKISLFLVRVPRYFILSHEPSTAYGPSRPLCPWCQTPCISTAP